MISIELVSLVLEYDRRPNCPAAMGDNSAHPVFTSYDLFLSSFTCSHELEESILLQWIKCLSQLKFDLFFINFVDRKL